MRISDWSSDVCSSDLVEHGLPSLPWAQPQPGAHVARASMTYLHSQAEAGTGCPLTMTFASVPALRLQPDLAELWVPKALATEYDPRNVGMAHKAGVTLGMAMTEKQGGTDVRANTRSEEHTSELQSLMRNSYAVF